jgi:hypothetical protein
MGNVTNSYTGSNSMPQGMRLLGRSRHRLESGMKMDLGNTSCEDVTHNRIPWRNLVKTLINFGAIYPLTSISWLMLPTATSLVCTYNE